MKEDRRRPLSRAMLGAELIRKEIPYLVLAAAVGILMALISAGPTSLLQKDVFTDGTVATRVILIISTVLAWSMTVLAVLWIGHPSMVRIHLIRTNRFSIMSDKLLRIVEDERVWFSAPAICKTEDAFYFEKSGRAAVDGRLRDMSAEGEILYVVVLHGRKDSIVGVYHPMMYTPKY